MNENRQFVLDKQLERVKAALEKNRMVAHIVPTAADVAPLVKALLAPGESVANGGSATVAECPGLYDLLRSGDYDYIDRDAVPPPEKPPLARQALLADSYIASANAVTEAGEIVEMDGIGNRVAAIVYGPAKVILIVGRNKIAPDLEAARRRVHDIAAPANTHRFGAATPCATTGKCTDCSSPDRICSIELILHQQKVEGRIQVILVGEDLGF